MRSVSAGSANEYVIVSFRPLARIVAPMRSRSRCSRVSSPSRPAPLGSVGAIRSMPWMRSTSSIEVDLALEVGPERGDGHGERIVALRRRVQPSRVRIAARLGWRDLRAENRVEAGDAQRELALDRGRRVRVDDARRDLAAAELGHQRGRAVESGDALRPVDALLEARRRLREQPEPAAGARDGARVEARRLEQHVDGAVVYLGGRPAHDTGERDRAAGVGDEKHVGR